MLSFAKAVRLWAIRLASAVLFGTWWASAYAYRPFESTDAAIADPSIVEIELGPFAYTDLRGGSVTEIPDLTLNLGLSSRWELVVDATRAITRSAGARNVETFETALLLKGIVREGVLQSAMGWSVATEFGLLLPTRNANDHHGAVFSLIGSQRSERATLHLNAAVSQNREGNAETFTGVILEGRNALVRPVGEFTYEFEDGANTRAASALLGAIWQRADNLSFDVALRAILEHDAWSYQGKIGVTWAFAVARS